jgi:dienelactone hydrolase
MRPRVNCALSFLLAVAVAGCSNSADSGTPDAGPADMAMKTYAAGVTTRMWVDSTRPTPANGSDPAKTSRSLSTEIWYPTPGEPSPGQAMRDAPLAPDGPFPLLLFVHSSSGSRTSYTYLTTGLAQAGYVVAAADFPLTAIATPGGASDLHVADQVGDLSFLCDQLRTVAADPSDPLKGAVDGLHYAVAGHSTGGAVAELAAFAGDDAMVKHDPRVSAVIPISGDACMFSASFFKTRSVPILVIGGTDDQLVRLANSGQWVFDSTNPPHLLAKLVGAQHVNFTELQIDDDVVVGFSPPTGPTSPLAQTLSAYGDASECTPEPPIGTDPKMAFETQHALTLELVNAYLDAQLKKSPSALDAMIAAKNPLVVFQE